MRTLLLSAAGLLGLALAVYVLRYRQVLRALHATRERREAVLATLARAEPLPADVELLFPTDSPYMDAAAAAARPVTPERFLAALRAGPYTFPSAAVMRLPTAAWRGGFWDPPTADQTYVMADGQRFDVLARRRGATWQLAVVEPWQPRSRGGLR